MPPASLASSSAAADPFTTTPKTVDPLAEALTNRIAAIQRQHRRETGRDLSLSDAIRKLADTRLPGDFPERRDAVRVRKFLASKGYTAQAIDGAIADIRRCGTAQCSEHIDETERNAVEKLLSPSPDWNNPRWSKERVNLGLNAEPIAGQF